MDIERNLSFGVKFAQLLAKSNNYKLDDTKGILCQLVTTTIQDKEYKQIQVTYHHIKDGKVEEFKDTLDLVDIIDSLVFFLDSLTTRIYHAELDIETLQEEN